MRSRGGSVPDGEETHWFACCRQARRALEFDSRAEAAAHCRKANRPLLTIDEANRIADGKVRVSPDPSDVALWRIDDDGSSEAHAPMTRDEWVAFLKDWAS